MSALKSMSTVSTVTLKGLWFHKLRYALTGLAVILGVAFMAGTSVLTDTMEKTFNGVIEQANQGIDVIVRHEEALQGVKTRERVDASLVDRIANPPGLTHGEVPVALPDLECDACTLQLIQVMTDKPPYDGLDDFSVGIEHPGDLVQDLDQALARA